MGLLLQGFVGIGHGLLLLLHLVEGEQRLLVTLSYAVEVLLQVAIVLEELLQFVDALLVVAQQLLPILSLSLRGLVLGVERDAEHGYYQY